MRIRDDDITPHNISKSAVSTKKQRERERERERERKREREKEGKKPYSTERKRDRIISMMGFDSATSNFLALLVNKLDRKN